MTSSNELDLCPECGGKLMPARDGHSIGMRCDQCGWGIWTTNPDCMPATPVEDAASLPVKSAEPEPIEPSSIEHKVDHVPGGDGYEDSYNFLDYSFADQDLVAYARSYLDEIGSVVLHGPFAASGSSDRIAGSAFEDAILAYLKLRFRRIERLNPAIRTGRPYEIIWESPSGTA
jgi:hypothetical protein